MDWFTLIPLIIKYGPAVQAAISGALSNTDIISRIKATAAPLMPVMEEIGAKYFPSAAPTLHVVAGALMAFNPDTTKWLQGSLNIVLPLKGLPNPNLEVDGIYGAQTKAAVEALQDKLGLIVDGVAGKVTSAAIGALMQNLPVIK